MSSLKLILKPPNPEDKPNQEKSKNNKRKNGNKEQEKENAEKKKESKLIPDKKSKQLFLNAKKDGQKYKSVLESRVSLPKETKKHQKKKEVNSISAIFKIKTIILGNHAIDTWYSAPYPEEYSKESILYNCEFCLKYMINAYTAHRHKVKCGVKRPPGDEIYRDDKISVFEVDGRKNKIYCQNLCLIAKMFLDHKTLYYDVEPFLFYVLTEVDQDGCHLAGYFSKEKISERKYNLSCILTLPHHQRKGYGSFLIDLSYLLSKKEKKLGSPEKPLSDLGLLSYKSYWKTALYLYIEKILDDPQPISINDISEALSMDPEDVYSTLVEYKMINNTQNGIELNFNKKEIKKYLDKARAKGLLLAKPELLRWSPYLIKESETLPSNEDIEN